MSLRSVKLLINPRVNDRYMRLIGEVLSYSPGMPAPCAWDDARDDTGTTNDNKQKTGIVTGKYDVKKPGRVVFRRHLVRLRGKTGE